MAVTKIPQLKLVVTLLVLLALSSWLSSDPSNFSIIDKWRGMDDAKIQFWFQEKGYCHIESGATSALYRYSVKKRDGRMVHLEILDSRGNPIPCTIEFISSNEITFSEFTPGDPKWPDPHVTRLVRE